MHQAQLSILKDLQIQRDKFMEPEQDVRSTQYMFYVLRSQDIKHVDVTLSGHYSFEFWKPTIPTIVPKSLFKAPFFVWSVLHYLKLFSTPNYSIFMVYLGKKMVHYSVVLPKYFRTPFITKNDLQIGPVWTHNEHRRNGIASYVIQKILQSYKKRGRKFWYIVREENIASRRLAEKAGFILYGKGVRKKKFGIRAIGTFVIEKEYS